jgi:hypothetical protein
MAKAKQLIKVSLEHIGLVAPLFDTYRQFYGQKPDCDGAHQFLFERVQQGQSVIFTVVSTAIPFASPNYTNRFRR